MMDLAHAFDFAEEYGVAPATPAVDAGAVAGTVLQPDACVSSRGRLVPLASLRPFDLVDTATGGQRRVRSVEPVFLASECVRLPVGVLGAQRALCLPVETRLSVAGPEVELHFALPEVLVRLGDVAGQLGLERAAPGDAISLVLERPALIAVDGVMIETAAGQTDAQRWLTGAPATDHDLPPVLDPDEAALIVALMSRRA